MLMLSLTKPLTITYSWACWMRLKLISDSALSLDASA
jgi:hypothetical protein